MPGARLDLTSMARRAAQEMQAGEAVVVGSGLGEPGVVAPGGVMAGVADIAAMLAGGNVGLALVTDASGAPRSLDSCRLPIDGRRCVSLLVTDAAAIRVADGGLELAEVAPAETQRNWNPVVAMAAKLAVAEVDKIRQPGGIDPERVITPAIFVQRIVLGRN